MNLCRELGETFLSCLFCNGTEAPFFGHTEDHLRLMSLSRVGAERAARPSSPSVLQLRLTAALELTVRF